MKSGFEFRVLLIVLGLSALAGCGPAVQPPKGQLALAESAVDNAASAGGYEYAPVELKKAQDKLTEARLDMQKKNNASALRLLEQAEVDAQLASEKTRTAKTQQAVNELEKNIDLLRQEIQRLSPQPQ
jgi:septal ring factor EnvC (AmiA/AmiB activator)